MQNETIKIKGMSCQHCRRAVETGLTALNGIIEARVILEEGIARVSFDETRVSLQDIYAAIEDAGYYVEK